MKKIKWEVLENRIDEEQQKILAKYGNEKITFSAVTDFIYEPIQFGVKWSALGVVDTDTARKFSNRLNEMIAVVNGLNEEFKDTEVEF